MEQIIISTFLAKIILVTIGSIIPLMIVLVIEAYTNITR